MVIMVDGGRRWSEMVDDESIFVPLFLPAILQQNRCHVEDHFAGVAREKVVSPAIERSPPFDSPLTQMMWLLLCVIQYIGHCICFLSVVHLTVSGAYLRVHTQ